MDAEQAMKDEAAAGAREGWADTQAQTPEKRRASAMRNFAALRGIVSNQETDDQDRQPADRGEC